jgi:AGZA family xanthine/uracil permease-like MFS transporter
MRRFFQLDELQTDVKTEVVAGVTTFLTMSYILVVNPQLLALAGMPFDAVLFASGVSAALATLVMGLWARYPIALAPGMGLNAYFALVVAPKLATLTGSQAGGWQAALGAVFFSGALFILLSLFKLREAIVNSVPSSLKLSIAGGIGVFIAFIGFKNGGLIQAHKATLITLGDVRSPAAILTIVGMLLIAILMARKIKGSALIGMVTITVIAMIAGLVPVPKTFISLPDPRPTFLALDLSATLAAGLLDIVFAFFFVDLFDTIGTLIGVAEQGGFIDEQGQLPRASRALMADAVGTLMGSLLGTSTVTSYIESAAGIAAGGRSGLTAVVSAALFLLAILFAPILRAVPPMATAPVLIIVGALMISSVRGVAWDDFGEALPAFLTLVGIAFTFSIADGMALGFIAHAVVKGLGGRYREVNLISWVLAALFVVRYALLH